MAVDDTEQLIRALYPELREMAGRLLRKERGHHTLQRTALAHEAFIRLFGTHPDPSLAPNAFLSLAAHQMRNILIDYGRRRSALKRGGDFVHVPLLQIASPTSTGADVLLSLNEALERLGRLDPRSLSVVELKFFGGFTNPETAGILGVSDTTVESDWQFARSWLFGELTRKSSASRN